MRKIIVSEHISVDGFVAGPNGEMDWIKLPDGLFDFVGTFTAAADAALYGRVTYEMMDAYWPDAANQPNAGKHEKEHSAWYNSVTKIVLSRTMKNERRDKTIFIGDNVAAEIKKIKEQPGKNILIFGSPSAAQALMQHNLIDEYWLFVNPVVLGTGISLFGNNRIKLELSETKPFGKGVTGNHYSAVK